MSGAEVTWVGVTGAGVAAAGMAGAWVVGAGAIVELLELAIIGNFNKK